jgi:hypothetical protein
MTSTYRRKTKTKRKLRHLTSIMPILIWQPDHVHMFRMPFKVGGMKDLQLHTPIKSRKKKVWANVFQKLSHLPREIYMKDIEFGFTPKDNYMGWNVDEHGIVWVNEQVKVPTHEIIGLAFRGIAVTYSGWSKTYNPYVKFNKYIIDILRNNKRVQTSLPYTVQGYKNSGTWEEIKSVKKDIWDITTSDDLKDMWYYFGGHTKDFTVPNPIKSVRICIEGGTDTLTRNGSPFFNFLLSKDTMQRHELQKHISSAPKPIDKRMTPYTKDEFDKAYEQYVNEEGETEEEILARGLLEEEQPTRSDGTRQEEDDPF